ncbi:MAG: hypothetical protein K6D54_00090 [Bacteroidales bacterium]|nr:hypothetical protein [Bacteroidales bacterium]
MKSVFQYSLFASACSLLLLAFSGCSNRFDQLLLEKINTSLRSELSGYNAVVWIPGIGCSGCITSAEQYYKDNREDTTLLFVFTQVVSKKNLIIRLQEDDIETRSNVLFDNDNCLFIEGDENNIYPYFIEIQRGRAVFAKRL